MAQKDFKLPSSDRPHLISLYVRNPVAWIARPGSFLIRRLGVDPFSHVGVLCPDGMVYEATLDRGVVATPLRTFLGNYRFVQGKLRHCPNPVYGMDFARSMVGHDYDLKGVLGAAFGIACDTPGFYHCSEFELATLAAAGLPALDRPGIKVSPSLSYWSR
jgi:hypothetical protein